MRQGSYKTMLAFLWTCDSLLPGHQINNLKSHLDWTGKIEDVLYKKQGTKPMDQQQTWSTYPAGNLKNILNESYSWIQLRAQTLKLDRGGLVDMGHYSRQNLSLWNVLICWWVNSWKFGKIALNAVEIPEWTRGVGQTLVDEGPQIGRENVAFT